jgi:hypothetical protein
VSVLLECAAGHCRQSRPAATLFFFVMQKFNAPFAPSSTSGAILALSDSVQEAVGPLADAIAAQAMNL